MSKATRLAPEHSSYIGLHLGLIQSKSTGSSWRFRFSLRTSGGRGMVVVERCTHVCFFHKRPWLKNTHDGCQDTRVRIAHRRSIHGVLPIYSRSSTEVKPSVKFASVIVLGCGELTGTCPTFARSLSPRYISLIIDGLFFEASLAIGLWSYELSDL